MTLSIGTLVGYLQLDDSNFERKADNADRKMAALQLQLEAIGRVNPTVTVEVDTQTAKLTELRAKLDTLRAQAADGLDVRVDTVATLTQLDAIQAKIRGLKVEAEDPLNSISGALKGIWSNLSNVDELGGNMVEAIVGDVDPAQLAVQLVTVAAGITAIGTAASVIPAVTGAAAGLTGALGGMAAAGLAAYEGLKDNSAATSAIDELKSDLTELEQTAGHNVLGGLLDSVRDVQSALPAVNAEIGSLSSALGVAGSDVVDGLVNGLKDAQPLLEDGAEVIERWAQGFDSWTQNGGLQEFLAEAQRELPVVVDTMDNFGKALLAVVDDLNIIGPPVLKFIDNASALAKNLAQAGDSVNHWVANLLGIKSSSDQMKSLATSTSAANAQMGSTGTITDTVAGALDKLDAKTKNLSKDMTTYEQDLAGLDNGSIAASNAQISLNEAVTSFSTGLNTNGKTLDENTAKGQANMSALNGIASAALSLVSAQAKAGGSVQTVTSTMATARAEFIKAAEAAGENATQAGNLATQYGLIPATVQTVFKSSGAAAAEAAAHAVADAYSAIPRTVGTDIITTHTDVNGNAETAVVSGKGSSGSKQVARAVGGTIYASVGMTVPGIGAYADTVDAKLAPGEEVISNWAGQASKYRATLKAINANADPAGVASTLGPVNVHINGDLAQLGAFLDVRVDHGLKQEAQKANAGWTSQPGVI